MPVLARLCDDGTIPIPYALAGSVKDPLSRLIDRLHSALRFSQSSSTALRARERPRSPAGMLVFRCMAVLIMRPSVRRPRPLLSGARSRGRRAGRLIGAMSVRLLARFSIPRHRGHRHRDDSGPGCRGAPDGAGRGCTLATVVGVLGSQQVGDDRAANLIQVDSDRTPGRAPVPFGACSVRWSSQAPAEILRPTACSIRPPDCSPPCLLERSRARREGRESNGGCLSVARFSFEETNDGRAICDAARLFSRLVATSISLAEQTARFWRPSRDHLRSAHVVARRIAASSAHHAVPDNDRNAIRPTVTLATLKPTDNLSTLVARLRILSKLAAG